MEEKESTTSRLFIAVAAPEKAVRSLSRHPSIRGVRWVRAEQVHLTLRFIGDFPNDRLKEIEAALATVSFVSFPLRLTGSGFFPHIRRPSVFWAGLAPTPELERLKTAIDAALRPIIPPEDKPFVPHVTLARIRCRLSPEEIHQMEQFAEKLAGAENTIDRFTLYRSRLSSAGAEHTPLFVCYAAGSKV